MNERPQIVQLLLTRMPPGFVDTTCRAAENKTPLMYAIEKKEIESIRMLRKTGASLNIKNDDRLNAKEIAESTNDPAILRALDPEKEQSLLPRLAAKVVSVLLYVLAWVNGALNEAVRQASRLNPELDHQNFDEVSRSTGLNEVENGPLSGNRRK